MENLGSLLLRYKNNPKILGWKVVDSSVHELNDIHPGKKSWHEFYIRHHQFYPRILYSFPHRYFHRKIKNSSGIIIYRKLSLPSISIHSLPFRRQFLRRKLRYEEKMYRNSVSREPSLIFICPDPARFRLFNVTLSVTIKGWGGRSRLCVPSKAFSDEYW